MSALETLVEVSLATPIVWRLMRMISGAYGVAAQQGFGGAATLAQVRPEEVLGGRVMDCLYWIGALMSAQTALWVACGFVGVLLNWFALAGLARLAARTRMIPLTARNAPSVDKKCPADRRSGVALPCL